MIEYLLSFEAINSQENIHRWYNVLIDTDLFGERYILTSWGKKGHTGGHTHLIHHKKPLKKLTICKKRLKGTIGDALNALLCAIGHNMRLIWRKIRSLFVLIWIERRLISERTKWN